MIRRHLCAAALGLVAACDRSDPKPPPPMPATPPTATAPAGPPTLSAAAATRPSAFAPGDLVECLVRGLTGPKADHGFTARVQADGTVGLPYLPPVAIGGLDRTTAASRIVEAYRAAHILSQAAVYLRLVQVGDTAGPAPSEIGSGDLVLCSVIGIAVEPEQAKAYISRVDANGEVVMPLVLPVHVAGLTDTAAARTFDDAYRQANVLSSAGVTVLTLEKAPPDAAHLKLPDGPIQPVPEPLRYLYEMP